MQASNREQVQFIVFYLAGSLVVERGAGRPPITNHQPGPRAEVPTGGLTVSAQQRQSTLAQLQMQVQGFLTQFVILNLLITIEAFSLTLLPPWSK